MKLREITIKNFRNLVDVTIPIDDTTVLVGENNSGKTSFLEALSKALPRNSFGRASPFDEYDYHMSKTGDSAETSEGIAVELWFREDAADEWPKELVQVLEGIVQLEPEHDLDSVGLRLTSKYDSPSQEFVAHWEFLSLGGQPLVGKGASPDNLRRFLLYVRLFYLYALRDADEIFSPRSQYWGRILRDIKIDEEKRTELYKKISEVNDAILGADARLEDIRKSLEETQSILSPEGIQQTSIRPLPLQIWDLMSKSEIVINSRGGEVGFPLLRHGQGAQSLSVLSIFQAYIDIFLKPLFEPETEAILALEEPEAHLHPQVTRALGVKLNRMKGQKIISTHSPYFLQEIPLTQIRMFRRNGPSSKILYIKRWFTVSLPVNSQLIDYCQKRPDKYSYSKTAGILTMRGTMEKKEYQVIYPMFNGDLEAQARLKTLCDELQFYLNDRDLEDFDRLSIRRIRGEIMFARGWLLCEGQSDYILLKHFADMLGKPLDQFGISIIDFQHDGSVGSFVKLAKTFEIPWVLLCDNDEAGNRYAAKAKEFSALSEVETRSTIWMLPENNKDIEDFVVTHGFSQECHEIVLKKNKQLSFSPGDSKYEQELAMKLKELKPEYALMLVDALQKSGAGSKSVPTLIGELINSLIAKVS